MGTTPEAKCPTVSDDSGHLRKDRKAKLTQTLTQKKRSWLISDISGNQAASSANFQQNHASVDDAFIDPDPVYKPPRRKRRRSKEERGLPSEEALLAMADVWLECQNRLWPQLVRDGHVPPYTAENAKRLADDFRERFLGNKEQPVVASPGSDIELAAGYARYSDDASNPRSLAQQLRLKLELTPLNSHFIPWEYVFADAAVTGTTAHRRGYIMAKQAMADDASGASTLYIDEIGRASRDAIEALELGRFLVDDLHKRLIGVSDNFDSTKPFSKMQLQIFAMLQEWFIDQLKSKVKRGMDDAFDAGRNTGLPAIGYKLAVKRDANGRPILGKDGVPVKELVVDPAAAKLIVWAFRTFGLRRRSPERIARVFNRVTAGGATSWDGSRIRQLLRRYKYVGVDIYRMTHIVRDRRTGKVKVKRRPRREWRVRRDRRLQIVPYSLWRVVKRRIKECGEAWKASRPDGLSRAEVYPRTLMRPRCYKCNAVMQLGHSGKYSSYCCPNGIHGKNGCDFRGYKTVTIVEKAILNELAARVFVPGMFENFFDASSKFLQELAAAPKSDCSSLRRELRQVVRKLNNLYSLAEQKGKFPGAEQRIGKLESEKARLQGRIRELEARNAPPPAPMSKDDVFRYLQELRDVLYQDVASAAPILRTLTGPIKVRPAGEKSGKRQPWIAELTPDILPALIKLDSARTSPSTGYWEYLHTRGWKFSMPITVTIEVKPKYECIASEVQEAVERGTSIQALATNKGVAWETIQDALVFAKTGKRPTRKRSGKKSNRGTTVPKYIQHAPEVVRRRDQEKQTFTRIAKDLGIDYSTAVRSYDYTYPELARKAVETGSRVHRPAPSSIPTATTEAINRCLDSGERCANRIARSVGCSAYVVCRVMSQRGITKGPEQRNAEHALSPAKKPKVRPTNFTEKVVRMHDMEGLSFSEIARQLNVAWRTAQKAYGIGRPDILAAARKSGEPPCRSNRSRMSEAKKRTIKELVEAGTPTGEIMRRTGASRTTVNRERLR